MIRALFGKRRGKDSLSYVDNYDNVTLPVSHMISVNAVHPNGRSVEIDGQVIEYRDVIQVVANEDSEPDNGIGGSIYLKAVPSTKNPGREVAIYNYTFDDDAFKVMATAIKNLENIGTEVRLVKGRDDLFRKMFFLAS